MPFNVGGQILTAAQLKYYNDTNIVKSGLVLYLDAGLGSSYPGTGTTWTDLSGNGYNGTLTNGPTYSTSGGGSIVFDGVDDYTGLSTSTGLLNLGSAFTISGWIKLTSTSQDLGILFSSLNVNLSTNTQGVGFYWRRINEYSMNSNTIRLQFGINAWAWQVFASNGISITDTNWHYIVVSASSMNTSSPTITFYIDGTAQSGTRWDAGSVGPINYGTNANSLRLSSIYTAESPGYQTNYSANNISNLLIYTRALSTQEVLQNYQAQRQRFGV